MHSFLLTGLQDSMAMFLIVANFKAVFNLKPSATLSSLAICLDFVLFTFSNLEWLENR